MPSVNQSPMTTSAERIRRRRNSASLLRSASSRTERFPRPSAVKAAESPEPASAADTPQPVPFGPLDLDGSRARSCSRNAASAPGIPVAELQDAPARENAPAGLRRGAGVRACRGNRCPIQPRSSAAARRPACGPRRVPVGRWRRPDNAGAAREVPGQAPDLDRAPFGVDGGDHAVLHRLPAVPDDVEVAVVAHAACRAGQVPLPVEGGLLGENRFESGIQRRGGSCSRRALVANRGSSTRSSCSIAAQNARHSSSLRTVTNSSWSRVW